jgi:hypothetical protein
MPSITFNIIDTSKRGVYFDEKILDYLWRKERNSDENYGLLLDIDKYTYSRPLTNNEVYKLLSICDNLYKKYNDEFDWEHNRVQKVSLRLKKLCQEAIEQNKAVEVKGI